MIEVFNQGIEVKRLSIPGDFGFGDPSETETSILVTKYSKIRELSRKEMVMQAMSTENMTYEIKIRYRDDLEIKKDDIIIWKTKRLKAITTAKINEIGKKKYLIIYAIYQNG